MSGKLSAQVQIQDQLEGSCKVWISIKIQSKKYVTKLKYQNQWLLPTLEHKLGKSQGVPKCQSYFFKVKFQVGCLWTSAYHVIPCIFCVLVCQQ